MFYPISHLYLIPFFPTLPYPIHSPAENTSKSDRPDLTAARVVVSGKSDNIWCEQFVGIKKELDLVIILYIFQLIYIWD